MPETPAPTDHISPESLPPVGILSRGGSFPADTNLSVGYFEGVKCWPRRGGAGLSDLMQPAKDGNCRDGTHG
jgi:hypothetical protein